MGTSRLHKRLGATQAVFQVTLPSGPVLTFDDSALASVSVTRGTGDPVGLATNAATVDVAGVRSWSRSGTTRVQLTSYGTTLVQGLTVKAGLQDRFSGRVRGLEVTDRDPKTTTTIDAGCRASLALAAEAPITATHDQPVQQLFAAVMAAAGASAPTTQGSGWDHVYSPGEPLTLKPSDVMDRYGAELGVLIRTTRAGALEALSLDYRAATAGMLSSFAPYQLPRGAVLKPVSWARQVSNTGALTYQRRTTSGVVQTGTLTTDEYGSATVRTTQVDATHVMYYGTNLTNALRARLHRDAQTTWQLQRLRIDMAWLVTHPSRFMRYLAGQLLAAEVGNPLALGQDWPTTLQGVYFISTLAERVTADDWTLELELTPHLLSTGLASPAVPAGMTWHQRPPDQTWDTQPNTTWNVS